VYTVLFILWPWYGNLFNGPGKVLVLVLVLKEKVLVLVLTKKSWSWKKYGGLGLGLGLETQSLGLGLCLDKKVLFTSLVCAACLYARRKLNSYRVSSSLKPYKRKAVKRPIPCPLCARSSQWLSRHLRQTHRLTQDRIDALLADCDDYRRRTTTANRRPKLPCPVSGCQARITHVGNHLRNKHNTTALDVRRRQVHTRWPWASELILEWG